MVHETTQVSMFVPPSLPYTARTMMAAAAWRLMILLLDVTGEGACPSAVEVERHLAELMPASLASPGPGPGHRASFSRIEAGIHIELRGADGVRMAARDLAAAGSCDELASALAVVIAAWEAELDPRIAGAVELPPPPPALPEPRAPAVAVAGPAPPPPPEQRPPPRYAVAMGLFASWVGTLAPGARIEGSFAPGDAHLGVAAALSSTGSRTQAVAATPGAARWTRIVLGAGPRYSFRFGGPVLDVHAQALAGLLRVEGIGLPVTAADTSVELGVAAGLRTGWSWRAVAVWIGLDALVWPGRAELVIGGLPDRAELPHLDLQLGGGVALGRFP
jgi:hypothetical protein